MASRNLILDPSEYDVDKVIADRDEILKYLPHRGEIVQLSAIIFSDVERGVCVGYRDIGHDEFWVDGHMPGMPVFPGVLMCEAAAQIAAYFCARAGLMGDSLMGLAGLEQVRFRGMVRPGDRLVIVCSQDKIRPGVLIHCRFQEFVNNSLVAEGLIKAAPLPRNHPSAS